MITALLFLSMGIIFSIAVIFFRIYLRTRRRSIFFMGIAAIFATSTMVFDANEVWTGIVISEAAFASFFTYGVFLLVEEESLLPKYTAISLLPFTPFIIGIYWMLYVQWNEISFNEVSIGIPYAVSGTFVFLSGLFLYRTESLYQSDAQKMGIVAMMLGTDDILYPFFRGIDILNVLGLLLTLLLAVLGAYYMNKLSTRQQFQKFTGGEYKGSVISKGEHLILDPEQYNQIMSELESTPILLFTRDLDALKHSSIWRTYFISTVLGNNVISPTDLPKILEISKRYLSLTEKEGKVGIVVIDCLEYIRQYNDFRSIVRFVARLRDFSYFYHGTLIVSTVREVWTTQELTILKRIL